ncbi:MAG: FAD-binding oxidoreductase [Bacteroidetes bacterium]|nr:FAD-binding oxidoreductase [Bacteroidota bacterium]MBI3482636.1 FAD-binding oxidoreductase [Bacteroidota bacterium]
MPIKTKVDHIIVGQGLAGSCLAIQLLNRGKKIVTFDEPGKNRASKVAAGLFNPITGKRMTKSWKADEIFPYLIQFYSDTERLLSKKFFHPLPIYRPFVSVEEQNEWMALSAAEGVKNFIDKVFTGSVYDQTNDLFGGILTTQSGYLDVSSFMLAVCSSLKKENVYRENNFDFSRLKVSIATIEYEDTEASSIIFCDGVRANNNPFFDWLPVRPLKGETLSVSMDEKPGAIFNRGVYLVPTDQDNSFTVGATYQPNDSSEMTSTMARNELEEKLRALVKIPFTVNHQNWGIRPTTPDRRPILGPHPIHKNIIAFNGMGTKGVSLAPYFSGQLADWLEGKTEIQNEVNIERFKALYSRLSSL